MEQAFLLFLGAAAAVSILVTVGIVATLIGDGAGFFADVSLADFLFGTTWEPVAGKYGVLPLLSASLTIAGIATIVAVPLGVGSAIYLSEYAPERVRRTLKPVLEVLAGMPTIVLGFFAIQSVTPALQRLLPFEIAFFNMLSAGIVVGVLIMPLISSLSEDAMRAVPNSLREGAYGVGATRRIVSVKIILPAALSGVVASIVLAVSRAVGETMAVSLAAGNQANLSLNVFSGAQTVTGYIVQVAKGEASRGSLQYKSIFALGLMLFVVTFAINLLALRLVRRYRTAYQ
jgi:phosphate transport system permease protein